MRVRVDITIPGHTSLDTLQRVDEALRFYGEVDMPSTPWAGKTIRCELDSKRLAPPTLHPLMRTALEHDGCSPARIEQVVRAYALAEAWQAVLEMLAAKGWEPPETYTVVTS